MWIQEDATRADYSKAYVAITSKTEHLSLKSDTTFGEMDFFDGSDRGGPMYMVPSGMYKIIYQSDNKPYFQVTNEKGIFITPVNFFGNNCGAYAQATWPPGQGCSACAFAALPH